MNNPARKRVRMPRADRLQLILEAAGRVALAHGLHRVTRDAVAAEADCATGLVSKYFPDLRSSLMTEAIARENIEIVADGLALRDPLAQSAPEHVLAQARQLLARR